MDSTSKSCAVIVCEFNDNYNNKPHNYFDFPKEQEQFKTWCTAIRRMDLLLKNNNYDKLYVCINHFSSDSYHYDDGFKLHEGAVPQLVKYQNICISNIY